MAGGAVSRPRAEFGRAWGGHPSGMTPDDRAPGGTALRSPVRALARAVASGRARVPRPLRRRIRMLVWLARTPRLAADAAGRRTLRRLLTEAGRANASSRELVELRLRSLGSHPFRVRRGTSDAEVVCETFLEGYHLPPEGCRRPSPMLIWDLGANIGSTMAHMAALYPEARIIGVELDAENAALCRANVAPWAARCEVIEGAVWPEDGPISYVGEHGDEYGYRVQQGGATGRTATAISPATLLARSGAPLQVDYVKMDIEGAERAVLRDGGGWADRVRCIKVELHAPYTVQACEADLRRLGFTVASDGTHWASVVGTRD